MSILYLHGFASGPGSRKARFFAERLRAHGIQFDTPDLAQGDFQHLTITRQLEFIERKLQNQEAVLIGSSLGGYLAALYAARHPEIQRLVLLAPAFGFYQLWVSALGPERLAQWRSNGVIDVFHYGEGREMPLAYSFLEDAELYPDFPQATQPALIFHGDRDQVVPVSRSLTFVAAHPKAQLVRFQQSEHELTDVLESIWQKAEQFLLTGDPSPDSADIN